MIEKLSELTGLSPETLLLLDLAAQAQRAGNMPSLPFAPEVTDLVVIQWEFIHPLPDNINSGQGLPIPRSVATEMVRSLSQKYPHVRHWIKEKKREDSDHGIP